MKKIIKIKTLNQSYDIVIKNNSLIPSIINEKKLGKKIFIIIEERSMLSFNNLALIFE